MLVFILFSMQCIPEILRQMFRENREHHNDSDLHYKYAYIYILFETTDVIRKLLEKIQV